MSTSSREKATLSAASLADLLRLLPGVLFRQRPDLSLAFVNPRIEVFTGLSDVEWLKQLPQRFWDMVHEADVAELKKHLERAAKTGEVVSSTFRIRHLTSKRIACVQEQRQAVRDANGALLGYDCVWLDVTQQMIAEGLQGGATWRETLTKLTDVLVHDFNNRMTGIHAISESIRSQIEAGHPFHEGLELVLQNAVQAKEIVQRLADLGQGKPGTWKFHNLNELVSDELELVRKIIPRTVQTETALAPESLPVYADAVELRRMFVELTLNGVKAMPKGGKLRFETSRADKEPAPPVVHGALPRRPRICLAVSDTGVGIAAHQLTEIFHPLSGTKPLNQSSGFGLCRARQTVESHHGAISVESVEERGTTFRVWLPEADFTESRGNRDQLF